MEKIKLDREKLIELRKKKMLSQAELARRTGVTRYTIHHIEAGINNPSLTLAMRIAKILECKVEDIIFFEKDVSFRDTEEGDCLAEYTDR